MIVVDSSVWIDYFRAISTPETRRLNELLGSKPLAIGDFTLTEVLLGYSSDRGFREAKRLLTSLMVIDLGGKHVAIQAANNYRKLRALGVTVRKTIDTIIATRCIESHYALLFIRRDFDPFVERLGLRSALHAD